MIETETPQPSVASEFSATSSVEETPSPQESISIVPLGIIGNLENIPISTLCEHCGCLAHRTMVKYDQPYSDQFGQNFVASAKIPGYECDSCHLEVYDELASMQALEAAYKVIKETGDEHTGKLLQASLKAGYRHHSYSG